MLIKKTKSRIIFFQSLFLLLFRNLDPADLSFLLEIPLSFLDETFGNEKNKKFDQGLLDKLIKDFVDNCSFIYSLISENANRWPFEEIPFVDRCALILGITEVLYNKETPHKVAIDEAINIAKLFKGEEANKLINGVLASVVKKYLVNDNAKYEEK